MTAAGSCTFDYDANGNVNSRSGHSISWYSYNLPNTIITEEAVALYGRERTESTIGE